MASTVLPKMGGYGDDVVMVVNSSNLIGATTFETKTLPSGTYQVSGCSARSSGVGVLAVYVNGTAVVTGTNPGNWGTSMCLISGTFTLTEASSVSIRQIKGSYGDASIGRAVVIWRVK